MGIRHNSNKFTLEKHEMTKKAANDLTSQCCLINRPIYSTGILNRAQKHLANVFSQPLWSADFSTSFSAPNPFLFSRTTTFAAQRRSSIRGYRSNKGDFELGTRS